jgi:hypothetical protein
MKKFWKFLMENDFLLNFFSSCFRIPLQVTKFEVVTEIFEISGCRIKAITTAFQAVDTGSIPVTRSIVRASREPTTTSQKQRFEFGISTRKVLTGSFGIQKSKTRNLNVGGVEIIKANLMVRTYEKCNKLLNITTVSYLSVYYIRTLNTLIVKRGFLW